MAIHPQHQVSRAAMRISILQGAFLPVPPVLGGGVEKIWFELGKAFSARGCEVTHVSRLIPGQPAEEVIEGVTHRRVGGYDTPSGLLKLKWLDLIYTIRSRRALPEADVVVTNTFWAPLILRPLHGRIYVSVERFPKGQFRIFRHAARLRVPSSAVRDAVLREVPKAAAARVALIPNPLPFQTSVPFGHHDANRQNVILYVGRLHPEKGLGLLLQSLRNPCMATHLKDWRVAIVGPWASSAGGGGEKYYCDLVRQAEGLPVDLAGPVNEESTLRGYYERASLFVYPSVATKGEAFGLAPLEAMAHGCVPIVSDLACFTDFVRHGENALVFKHQGTDAASHLAAAISFLIENRGKRQQLSNSAKNIATTHARDRIADMFLTDFERVMLEQAPAN